MLGISWKICPRVRNGPLPSLQIHLIWNLNLLIYHIIIWINKSIFTQCLKNWKKKMQPLTISMQSKPFSDNYSTSYQYHEIIMKGLKVVMYIVREHNPHLLQLMREAKQKKGKFKFYLIFHRLQGHLDANYPMTRLFHKLHVQHHECKWQHWHALNYECFKYEASRERCSLTHTSIAPTVKGNFCGPLCKKNTLSRSMWIFESKQLFPNEKSPFEILDLLKFEGGGGKLKNKTLSELFKNTAKISFIENGKISLTLRTLLSPPYPYQIVQHKSNFFFLNTIYCNMLNQVCVLYLIKWYCGFDL